MAAVVVSTIASLAGCGGGGGGSGESAQPPGAPGAPAAPAVSAAPGNGQAAFTWTAVSGATSYNVYTSATSPVSPANTKAVVATTGTTLPALTNGVPVFAAVSAVGAGGESPLSNEVCAVPTAASSSGLTPYDPLCANTLDGTRWQSPLFGRRVASGAMVLSAQAANMESYNNRGLIYATTAVVNPGGQRVTTLQTSISVPSTSASRTGQAEIRANARLAYQPPATRLNFPGGNADLLAMQVGLRDDGNGLRAFRDVSHCDNPSCTAISASGVAFADPAGFGGEAPAAYDTTYVVTAAFDESSGILAWTITGGSLNLSGTANASGYLTGNAAWAALGTNPLASTGFASASVRVRVIDNAGGSSGTISAQFDDVSVGFNNAAATAWDDFSGTGANSGPTGLSAAKWTGAPVGTGSMSLTAGSLVGHAHASTPNGATLSIFNPVVFSDPAAINTIQADFSVSACSNSLGGTNRVGIAAAVYNDGTAGTTAPDVNQPSSRVGDITASLFIDCTLGDVRFQVTRFDTNASQTILSNSANAIIPKGAAAVVGSTHTLMMKWDPVARVLTLQADGQAPVVVDPKTVNSRMLTAAPYVKEPNAPNKNLSWFLFFPASGSGGATASVDFKANNVFTAP